MLKVVRLVAPALLLGVCGHAATLLFDNASRGDFQSNRGAAVSPIAAITVSSDTVIGQIGALVDLNSAGNMKFLIFDFTTNNLLFSTGSQLFADNGLAYKVSSAFAPFTLHAGTTYGIGAIADVGGLWEINAASSGTPFTENGITASDDVNGNVVNFGSPAITSKFSAMIMIQLYSGTTAVPEPATSALLAFGLGTSVFAGLRARARRGSR